MTLSRRYLRLFLAVFLVVFLAGSGLSGAWALWSQKASTVATVQTGSWTVREEGFSLPLNHQIHNERYGKRWGEAKLTWSPRNSRDESLQVVTEVTVEPLSDRRNLTYVTMRNTSIKGSADVRVEIGRGDEWEGERFRVTITPVLDGVRARPTSFTYTMPDLD